MKFRRSLNRHLPRYPIRLCSRISRCKVMDRTRWTSRGETGVKPITCRHRVSLTNLIPSIKLIAWTTTKAPRMPRTSSRQESDLMLKTKQTHQRGTTTCLLHQQDLWATAETATNLESFQAWGRCETTGRSQGRSRRSTHSTRTKVIEKPPIAVKKWVIYKNCTWMIIKYS